MNSEDDTRTDQEKNGDALLFKMMRGPALPVVQETSSSREAKNQEYLDKLAASKPKREDFKSQDEFEEALGGWMSHQGRILALNGR